MSGKTQQGPNADLTHEVQVAVGGKSILTSRCTERDAVRTAKALGVPFDGNVGILWPITIRKIGAKPQMEANALAQALAPKLVVPDGQIMVFAIGTPPAEKKDGKGDWIDGETALTRITEMMHGTYPNLVWSVVAVEPGTVITR